MATTTQHPARVARTPGLAPPRYAFGYWMTNYRRTWRGTALSGVLEPIGFLAAMGLGLGALVDSNGGAQSLGGSSYLEFLAPGLLAASAIQTAMFESTYPVLGAIKWQRAYYAQLATALRVRDVLVGHVAFVAFRIFTMGALFVVVMALFGAIDSPWALVMLLATLLTGLAITTPVFAFAARQQTDSGFAMLFRFGLTPMFLFSGTFFPISQLPDFLEPLAWLSPLWHGVEISRGLALGGLEPGAALGHVAYLMLWAVGGYLLALRSFTHRLVT